MNDFVGAKAALLYENKLLVFLRDNKTTIPFPNMWDFPGGGREGNETPLECLAREMMEEFGITLKPESVIWEKQHPSMHQPGLFGYFFVARITKEDIDTIAFGNEGQHWQLMGIEEFLAHKDAVPHLKNRLSDYLNNIK